MVIILFILFSCSSATKIVEYRFGYNYGQVFHDFSGNGNDAVNGVHSTDSSKDAIATDRGAYLTDGDFQITLPTNDKVSNALVLPSAFTIAAWVLSLGDKSGNFIYRQKDPTDYFYVKRSDSSEEKKGSCESKSTSMINGRININGNDSKDQFGASNTFAQGNIYGN